jgi:hypothetical protein
MTLEQGSWQDSFAVRNDGGQTMTWTAVGVPAGISLSLSKGSLLPGIGVAVTVTVDHTVLPAGPRR